MKLHFASILEYQLEANDSASGLYCDSGFADDAESDLATIMAHHGLNGSPIRPIG